MSDQFRDPFEAGAGGGPPVISWKKSDPGDNDTFTGILFSGADKNLPLNPYRTVHLMDKEDRKDRNARNELMYWPPDGAERRQPVGIATWHRMAAEPGGNPQGKEPQPVGKTEFYLTTEYRKFEFCSGPVRQRMADANESDNGDRRVIWGGPDLRKKISDALAKVGNRPVHGMKMTIVLTAREENKGGEGETARFAVTIERPTPETTAKADAARDRLVQSQNSGDADPWASTTAATEEDPPF